MAASKTVTWNSVSSATVPGLVIGPVKRQMIGEIRGTYIAVPGRVGSWFYPEKRGLRNFTMECHIETATWATERRTALLALADWLDVEVEARLTLSDEPSVYYMATLAEMPEPEEWMGLATFDLSFNVQPYSFGLNVSSHVISGGATFSEAYDYGLSALVYPEITIQPTVGTINYFQFLLNGDQINFVGSLTAGNSLIINSTKGAVLLNSPTDVDLTGAYDPNYLLMGGISGVFPTLIPGVNTMTFTRVTGSASAVTITIRYRKTYRR